MKFLIVSAAVLALVISSGVASAGHGDAFTISGGSPETIAPTTDGEAIPEGTTGYADALLTISGTRAYKFEFLGCGDATLDNRFYINGTHKFFDCATSQIGDSFIANMNVSKVKPHSPFHFQSGANQLGPSVFNGEGPFFDGWYSNVYYSNVSIFYAIDGSTSDPGLTSGNAVLLGFTDGGAPNDNDHQDLVVRISLPSEGHK
jgi:hypothetical protein